MVWNVKLPEFNGSYEAGVAVGVDPALAENRKLVIHSGDERRSDEINGVIGLSLRWVWANLIQGKSLSDEAVDLYMYFTYAALRCGIVSLEDGDLRAEDLTTNYGQPNGADTFCKEKVVDAKVTMALTVAVATKASFWLTNHHLGGSSGKLGSYIGKVVRLKMNPNAVTRKDVIEAVHTVGHWTSTKTILGRAGVKDVLEALPAIPPTNHITLSKDAQLRFGGLPAGTLRLAVAYEAARCIARSRVLLICPQPSDFIPLSETRSTIIRNPARYHIGSLYLTEGARADYDDATWDTVLGRLGCFVATMLPRSTLAKSPHLSPDRIESYPDYDGDFAFAKNIVL